MAITLGGIMRGGLPVASQYLAETPDANREIINAVATVYDGVAPDINKDIDLANTNLENIEDIANTYGVPSDIVAGLYSATGGKRKDTIVQLKNLLDTYGSADLIPVEDVSTAPDTETDVQEIDVGVPVIEDDETVFQNIASLFKRLGPEQAIAAFAREKNISVDQVKDFISGNVGKYIPEYDAKTKITSEAALAALEKPKDADKPLVSGGLSAAFYDQLVAKQKDAMETPGKYSKEHENLLNAFPVQFLKALENDSSASLIMRKKIASMFTKIRPVDKAGEIPEQFKGIMKNASDIIATGIGDPKVLYDPTLMDSLIKETSAKNIDFDEVGSLVQQILNTKKIPKGPLSTDDIFFNSLVTKILRAPGNEDLTLPEAQEMAAAFIKTNPTYDSQGVAWGKIIAPGGGVGVQALPMYDTGGSETISTALKDELTAQMGILGDAFDSIGSLKQLLKEDDFLGGNNTFASLFTTIRMRGGDVLSMLGAPKIAERLMGAELQKALQQRISCFSCPIRHRKSIN